MLPKLMLLIIVLTVCSLTIVQPASSKPDFSGTYETDSALLNIVHKDDIINFEISAHWNANVGGISGQTNVQEDTAIYVNKDEDCILVFQFYDNGVKVSQKGLCGFGFNVSAAGKYVQRSGDTPIENTENKKKDKLEILKKEFGIASSEDKKRWIHINPGIAPILYSPSSEELRAAVATQVADTVLRSQCDQGNAYLSNLRVFKNNDKGIIALVFSYKTIGCGTCRFLVRLYDKNGNHLTSFETQQHLELFQRDYSRAKSREIIPDPVILIYNVNQTFLRDTKIVEFGFLF